MNQIRDRIPCMEKGHCGKTKSETNGMGLMDYFKLAVCISGIGWTDN